MNPAQIVFGFLVGALLTSLFCLLLFIPLANVLSVIALMPGWIGSDIILGGHSIPGLLIFNVVFYSLAGFVVAGRVSRRTSSTKLRRLLLWSIVPVASLFCLTWFPSANPLWPRGMGELARQEADLNMSLPLNTDVTRTREVLANKKIQFQEWVEKSNSALMREGNIELRAEVGDRILSSRYPTKAVMFPCGFDMEIYLVFGQDGKLKSRYIHRFPMCP